MRKAFFPVSAVLAFSLLAAQGCQRLNVEQTLSLGAGEVKSLSFDPPRSDQKVTVSVTAVGSPVDVYLVLGPDQAAVSQSLEKGKAPEKDKVLASREKMQEGSLEATIPAKTGFALLVAGAQKESQVKIKVQGR